MARTPSSWQARMTRTAISPRLAIRTRSNIVANPCRAALLQEGANALLPLRADAQPSNGRRRRLARLIWLQGGHGTGEHLGGAHACRAVLPDLGQRLCYRRIQFVERDDLVNQPDGERTLRVEALGGQEERAGVRLSDLRHDELRDDRWGDA